MKLDNRTAVIVGGTGIGYATARLFIEAGADVIMTGRTAAPPKNNSCWA